MCQKLALHGTEQVLKTILGKSMRILRSTHPWSGYRFQKVGVSVGAQGRGKAMVNSLIEMDI